jgi:hypothetical protein
MQVGEVDVERELLAQQCAEFEFGTVGFRLAGVGEQRLKRTLFVRGETA